MIQFLCAACGATLRFEDVFAGQLLRCRSCRKLVSIPALGAGRDAPGGGASNRSRKLGAVLVKAMAAARLRRYAFLGLLLAIALGAAVTFAAVLVLPRRTSSPAPTVDRAPPARSESGPESRG